MTHNGFIDLDNVEIIVQERFLITLMKVGSNSQFDLPATKEA